MFVFFNFLCTQAYNRYHDSIFKRVINHIRNKYELAVVNTAVFMFDLYACKK